MITKLTLKSSLSLTTQAKINALRMDTLKPADKITSTPKSQSKKPHKLKTPLPSKTKPDSQTKNNTALKVKASSTTETKLKTDEPQDQQAQSQQEGRRQRPYRTREEYLAFRERIQAAQTWLKDTYPAVFDWDAPKPLKLGIIKELLPQRPATISYHQLQDAIGAWTHRRAYLQNLIDQSQRCDLDGQPVEDILPEHKDHARQQLEHKQAQLEEQQRRRADYQQRRKLSRKMRDNPVDNNSEREES